MDIQLRRKAKASNRNHRIEIRGVASLPAERISEKDKTDILTAEPSRSESAPGNAVKFPVYEEIGDRIFIPKYLFFDRFYNKKKDVIDFFNENEEPFAYKFKGELYPSQMDGAEKILKVLGKKRGVTGKGRCGTGKTVIGTYLMSRIPGKHMVLVDQTQIAEQWLVECLTHLENPKISFIMPLVKQRQICKKYSLDPAGRTKIDTTGHIIIASAQTLMRVSKDTEIPISLIIVDEAHAFAAPSFSKSIFRVSFKYSVALTATDKRSDGLEWIFKDILGPSIITLKGRRMNPLVVSISVALKSSIDVGQHKMFWCSKYHKMRTYWACRACDNIAYCQIVQESINAKIKKVAYHEIWARLAGDPFYNKTVVNVIRKLHRAGRNILVLSKFKDHLRLLRELTIAQGVPETDTSLYFGGMDKDKCLPFPITFATFGIAYKALNAPDKDAEVLSMPVSEVEQPAGRIERQVVGKNRPIIVDFVINNAPMLLGSYKKRRKFYNSAGYLHGNDLTWALNVSGSV